MNADKNQIYFQMPGIVVEQFGQRPSLVTFTCRIK